MTIRAVVVTASCAALLAGCGQLPSGGGTSTTSASAAGVTAGTRAPNTTGEVVGIATVMDTGKGPELCLGGVADSYPPQCGGPPIVGWDWAKAPPSEQANGSRWGVYAVIGTFDGTRFTVTRPPTTPEDYPGTRPTPAEPELKTPCKPPSGGWRVLDAATTTQDSLAATLEAAPRVSGYAGAWVDQSLNTADPATQPELMNDPTKLVLNVATAGDVRATEQALRRTWGGALCVTHVRLSEARLTQVQTAIGNDRSLKAGLLSSSIDVVTSTVHVEVVHDDGTLQRRLDAAYGPGLVTVGSALFPYQPR